MKDKYKAPYYTIEHWVYHPGGYTVEYANGPSEIRHFSIEKQDDGTLFSSGQYRTKLLPENIPNRFIKARIGKCWGYIDVTRASDIVYHPNKFVNHLFRDDGIFIKFDEGCINWDGNGSMPDDVDYDVSLWGLDLVNYLAHVTALDLFDTSEIKKNIEEKIAWHNEKYPNEHDNMTIEEFNEYWDKLIKEAKEKDIQLR